MLIIGNGKLITRSQSCPFFEDGAVVLDDTKVIDIGNTADIMKQYPKVEFMDVKGNVIMPGMINTHEHIYSAMARGLSIRGYHPQGFLDILDGQWWTIDRALTPAQIRYSALDTMISCIRNGVTTIFDHHASFGSITDSLFLIADAAKETGIRACLCYEVSDRDGKEKAREAVLENAHFIEYARKDDSNRIAGMMGMHAQFTISDETFAYAAQNTPEGIGYHIHVAEGIEDLHACLKEHGKRIVDRLYDMDILGQNTLLAHCIYVNPHEMELISDTETMVVHNPESNMGNACGCPPIMEFMQRGILTGLGTDGYTHDMLESYKVANILHKHHLCDANAAWSEIPEMLFENNARIANRYFQQKLGVLEKNAAADVIVLDYNPPTPMNADNINSHILFGMTGHDVVTTIANGKVLMQNRELCEIDVEKVMAEAREESAKLWKKINE